jgi:hypothetical protein
MSGDILKLASYRRGVEQIHSAWPSFIAKRAARLEQQVRHGNASEKVAENILEDLFTGVLDWALGDLNNQLNYADLVLSSLGIKRLLIEVKRPGALAWNRRAVEAALDQASRYASEQKVNRIVVSDGYMLYAADIEHGGLSDRIFVSLENVSPPEELWWLSVQGIYRPCELGETTKHQLLPEELTQETVAESTQEQGIIHPKYGVPARCFAYVGDASNTATWKLPYRILDGSPDVKRLPKAIQSILTNYRGARVSTVPEGAIPDVLVRLAQAAMSLGKMPSQTGKPANVYVELAKALRQLGRLEEV